MSHLDDEEPPALADAEDAFSSLNAASLAQAAQNTAQRTGQSPGGPMPGQPPQMKPEDFKHFITLYPCYLNPKLTVSKGRRLPLHLVAGCDDPWVMDIAEACAAVGFRKMIIEGNKRHPRDQYPNCPPQRLRVELKDKEGNLAVPTIKTKDELLAKIAPIIPQLPNRRMRLAQIAQQRAMMLEQQKAAQKQAAAAQAKGKKEEKKATKGKKK